MISAAEAGSGCGSVCHERACRRTGTTGSAGTDSSPGPSPPSSDAPSARPSGPGPSQARAPESVRMWAISAGPESGGTGTTVTPAMSPPSTASTVCAVGRANTATRPAPATRSATAVAAAYSSAREKRSPPMISVSGSSPPAGAPSGRHGAAPTVTVPPSSVMGPTLSPAPADGTASCTHRGLGATLVP